jgi:hypothetical protein
MGDCRGNGLDNARLDASDLTVEESASDSPETGMSELASNPSKARSRLLGHLVVIVDEQ